MADGRITIQADIDQRKAQAELDKLTKDISKLQSQLSSKQGERSAIEAQMKQAEGAVEEARQKIKELNEEAAGGKMNAKQKAEMAMWKQQLSQGSSQYNSSANRLSTLDGQIGDIESRIADAETRAGGFAEQIARANTPMGKLQNLAEQAQSKFAKLGTRIKKLASRVFVFSMITKALRSIRTGMQQALQTNEQASQSFAALKGALNGLYGTMANALAPAISRITNFLAKLLNTISAIIAKLFGVQKGMNRTADAAENAGGAAEEASKSIAGFDEINQLSDNSNGGGGGGAAAEDAGMFDINIKPETMEKLNAIKDAVLQIWDGIKMLFDGIWNLDWDTAWAGFKNIVSGLALLVYNIMLLLYEYISSFLDWLTDKVGGEDTALGAIFQAMKKFLHGIVTGDIYEIAEALYEICLNALQAISNVINSFCDWVDKNTNGILTVITGSIRAFVNTAKGIFEGAVQIIKGIWQTIKGICEGSVEDTGRGIMNILLGIVNAAISVVEGAINTIISAINSAISLANSVMSFFGGGSIGMIGNITIPRIPALASGAVIPPNREFLAVLGDQSSGNNIEAPESLIRDIVRQESGNAVLKEILHAIQEQNLAVYLNDKVIAEAANRGQRQLNRAYGR